MTDTIQPKTRKRVPLLRPLGISKAAFQRLPRYHQIATAFMNSGRTYVSSNDLADILEINETLVRKDMSDLQVRGRQNLGYATEALLKRIEEFLGLQEVTEAVIVGTGHLGKALATYSGFEPYGLHILHAFDNDPEIIGTRVGKHKVLPILKLASTIQKHSTKLMLLCVPKAVAQEMTDIAVKAGVRSIWNFTTEELKVPSGIYVRNEQIIAGFMALSYFLKTKSAE
jgi:redox-sensing transcriptional repressor